MPLWRSQRVNVYHRCMRCDTRQPLSNMIWQNGILICAHNKCVDTAIVGSRDIRVAREVGVWRHELEPDPKLVNPTSRKDDLLDVMY
jgi:hypothetical protein